MTTTKGSDFFAPMRFEAEVLDCEVEGTLPAALQGSFYGEKFNFLTRASKDRIGDTLGGLMGVHR